MNRIKKIIGGSIVLVIVVGLVWLIQKPETVSVLSTLQQHMALYCKQSETNTHALTINPADLPLRIDHNDLYLSSTSPIVCVYPSNEPKNNGFISISKGKDRPLFLYDLYSYESGRGGEPLLGPYGQPVIRIDSITLYAYVSLNSDTQATEQEFSVRLRGVNDFFDTMHASYDTELLSFPRSDLESIIDPFLSTIKDVYTEGNTRGIDVSDMSILNKQIADEIKLQMDDQNKKFTEEIKKVVTILKSIE